MVHDRIGRVGVVHAYDDEDIPTVRNTQNGERPVVLDADLVRVEPREASDLEAPHPGLVDVLVFVGDFFRPLHARELSERLRQVVPFELRGLVPVGGQCSAEASQARLDDSDEWHFEVLRVTPRRG